MDAIRRVAETYEVEVSELTSGKRTQDIAWARQVAMYVLRRKLELPYKTIGQLLGGRDHSTVFHGVRRISGEMASCPDIRKSIQELMNGLEA